MSMDIPRPYSANQTVVEDISETHVRYRPHFSCYASISLLAMMSANVNINIHKKNRNWWPYCCTELQEIAATIYSCPSVISNYPNHCN